MKVKMIGDELELLAKVTGHLLWSKTRDSQTSVTKMYEETAAFLKERYNANYHLRGVEEYIEFESEQEYLLFKLEWS